MTRPARARVVSLPGGVQDRIDAYWSLRAAAYDDHQQRAERRDLDRAAWTEVWGAALGDGPLDVLDLGTGSGHVACLLAGLGHRVTGIDLALPMLARARSHAARLPRPPRFLHGDAVAPGFPDATFDAVVGRYVAWTLREPDRAAAAWHRLLRPGGRLALVDTAWFPDGVDAPGEERPGAFATHYDAEVRSALPLAEGETVPGLVRVLEAAGFGEVGVQRLDAVLALDLAHGVAPGHQVRTQHLVTAVR